MGNKRVALGNVSSADTDVVASGLHWIDNAQASNQNAATNTGIKVNTAASGAGDYQLASATTGSSYFVTLWGV